MYSGTSDIALFPLGMFLLPGERTRLHIFEPRYRQLFKELEVSGAEFGIPYTTGSIKRSLGSTCRLVKVIERYESGECDVLIECSGLFRLEEFQSAAADKLYPKGKVKILEDLVNEEASDHVIAEFKKLVVLMEKSQLPFSYPTEHKSLSILSSLNLEPEEKMRFILKEGEEERNETLYNLIRFTYSIIEQEASTERGVYLN